MLYTNFGQTWSSHSGGVGFKAKFMHDARNWWLQVTWPFWQMGSHIHLFVMKVMIKCSSILKISCTENNIHFIFMPQLTLPCCKSCLMEQPMMGNTYPKVPEYSSQLLGENYCLLEQLSSQMRLCSTSCMSEICNVVNTVLHQIYLGNNEITLMGEIKL